VRTRVHVTVCGRVQGVAFRHYTERAARENRVTGWVRNLPDGAVEAVFEGEQEDVDAQLAWCRRGPELARVEQIEVVKEEYRGEFATFSVRS
jgi:acylphosphatase